MNRQTEYVESLSSQIVDWDMQIDQLKDKAASAASGEESEYSGMIAALKLKRDEAAHKLQGIAQVSDGEWNDMKSGSEDTMDEIRSVFSDAITRIR
jgi:hypothetical protein